MRFRSEQQLWYHIQSQWEHEGQLDAMNKNKSQRTFYQFMRTHAGLQDKNYCIKAERAWPIWKSEHPIFPRR